MPLDKLRYGTSDLLLLAEIAISPTYAYDLCKRLEDKPIKFPQRLVYPTLSRLALDGYLSRHKGDREVTYTITPKGLTYLKSEINRWKSLCALVDATIARLPTNGLLKESSA